MKKLCTENMINPIGIDVSKPCFSWQTVSEKRGCMQRSYRIFVATNSSFSEDSIVWDSGESESEQCFNIEYSGAELLPRTRYYWRVQVKDNFECIHNSETAFFETGLMEDAAFEDTLWLTRGEYPKSLLTKPDKTALEKYNGTVFTIETRMKIERVFGGIVFGYIDSDNFFRCRLSLRGNLSVDRFTMGKYSNYIYKDNPAGILADDIKEKEIDLKICVDNGIIKVYLNGKECGSGKAEPFAAAKIGFDAVKNSNSSYSFIRVMQGNEEYIYDDFGKNDIKHLFSSERIADGRYIVGDKCECVTLEGVSAAPDVTAAPMFRREFSSESGKSVVRARLYATAAGVYNVYINGRKATDSYLNPGRTTYSRRLMYQTFDVTELIKNGENAIGVVLGHGWWNAAGGEYGTRLAFTGKLIITYSDGCEQTIEPDDKWQYYFDGPVRSDNIFDGEYFDNTKSPSGWDMPEFCDTSLWTKPVLLPKSAFNIGKIQSQNIPYNTVYCEIPAVSVSEPLKNVYVYDFGQNVAGICRIKVTGSAGTKIKMRFAEKLFVKGLAKDCWHPDDFNVPGTIWTRNMINGSDIIKAQQTDYFVLKGDTSGETFEADLIYHGFQYVEITGLDKPIDKADVKAVVIATNLDKTGEFECSDRLINKFVSNTNWSQIDNFLSVPTDCPQRNERYGWTADAQIFARTGAYLRDINAFFEKYERDICDVQNKEGVFPDAAPGWAGQRCKGGWSDAGVIIPWQMYMQYGNRKILENSYDSMKRFVDREIEECDNYIDQKSGSFGDWLAGEHTPQVMTETACAAYSASLLSQIADILGKDEDAEIYRRHFSEYCKAYNREFVGEDGISKCDPAVYGEAPWGNKNADGKVDTQSSYILGIYFGIFDKDTSRKAAARLAELVRKSGYHIKTGFLGVSYILPVLTKYGYTEEAYKMIQQTEYPSWLYAVVNGSTSIYETWYGHRVMEDGTVRYTSSFNHYSYGSATEWLFKGVLGIERDENNPAFKHIILCPALSDALEFARGSYDSAYGMIRSRWERTQDGFIYEATVPANSYATLKLNGFSEISENGKFGTDIEGVKSVHKENDTLLVSLMSGSYRFEIKK